MGNSVVVRHLATVRVPYLRLRYRPVELARRIWRAAGRFRPNVNRRRVFNREQHLDSLYALMEKQASADAAFSRVTNPR
jgi:hypothetical protein